MRVTTTANANAPADAPAAKKRKVQVVEHLRLSKTKSSTKEAINQRTFPNGTSLPNAIKGKGKAPALHATDVTAAPARGAPIPSALPRSFKIIAGSYEKLLYGLEATFAVGDDPTSSKPQPKLKPIFIFPAHVSCLKAVAASPSGGKWLATGSSDEIIKVWDLRRRKEIGGLMHHEGSITYLTFASRSHLLSASEDGTLCLFRARDWAVLRTLSGHKGRVNCVGVHPSGKLALSVGKDRTLRMWDLMRGKGSASTKLGKEGEVVCWSPSGSLFAVQSGTSVDVFSTGMSLLHSILHPSRVHDVKFFRPMGAEGQPEFLLVAAEDKKVTIYELSDSTDTPPKVIAELVGQTNRVKAIDVLTVAIPPYIESKSATYASTVSSDGHIRLFDLGEVVLGLAAHPTEQPVIVEPVTQYDTKGSRLTCVAMGDSEEVDCDHEVVGEKRKRDHYIEDDAVDEWSSQVEEAASEDTHADSEADQKED